MVKNTSVRNMLLTLRRPKVSARLLGPICFNNFHKARILGHKNALEVLLKISKFSPDFGQMSIFYKRSIYWLKHSLFLRFNRNANV